MSALRSILIWDDETLNGSNGSVTATRYLFDSIYVIVKVEESDLNISKA